MPSIFSGVTNNQYGFLDIFEMSPRPYYVANVLCEDSSNCLTESGGLVLTEPNTEVLLNFITEDDGNFLLEDGISDGTSVLLLQANPRTPYYFLLEDFSYLLYESLNNIELED